jgi:hypothetical protein
MNQAGREYYPARIAAERAAAQVARNDHALTIHLDLAEQYQRVVDGKQAPPTPAE